MRWGLLGEPVHSCLTPNVQTHSSENSQSGLWHRLDVPEAGRAVRESRPREVGALVQGEPTPGGTGLRHSALLPVVSRENAANWRSDRAAVVSPLPSWCHETRGIVRGR